MNLRHFENKARQSYWVVHVEAWQRSGLTRTEYCRVHRLTKDTLDRWLKYFAGNDAARKQAELRRQKRLEERAKRQKKGTRRRFAISADVRNRGVQAFWAMHVEAMNWSGMAFANTPLRCIFRRIRCAYGVTDWTRARSKSTGGRIFIPPPSPGDSG